MPVVDGPGDEGFGDLSYGLDIAPSVRDVGTRYTWRSWVSVYFGGIEVGAVPRRVDAAAIATTAPATASELPTPSKSRTRPLFPVARRALKSTRFTIMN